MDNNTTPLNENTGGEFTAIDQTMGSAPEVEQEIVNDSQEQQPEQPQEPSELDRIRQEKENLLEALRQEREERRKYREELEATRSQQPVYKSPEEQERERQLAEARRVLKEELGVMTKEDWEQLSKQEKEAWERGQREKEEREAFNKEIESLEKEFNGQNGKPKFDKNKLVDYLEFGQKNRIFNVKAAFQMMHLPEIASSITANAPKPTSFPTQNNSVQKGGMPDFSKMTSAQIMEWQKAQGYAKNI